MRFCEADCVFQGLGAAPVRIGGRRHCLCVPNVVASLELEGVPVGERLYPLLVVGVRSPQTAGHAVPVRRTLIIQTHSHIELRLLEIAGEHLVIRAV